MNRSLSRVRAPVFAALAVLCYCLVTNAWQADDAFITYRTVKNLWHGMGLTWNPGWRVQAYTHPLWMMVASLCYGISGECYFSMLTLAIALGLASGAAMLHLAKGNVALGALAILLLTASSAVIQYGVSGLENPLLFLLLAAYASVARGERAAAVPWRSALCAALVGLTRMDALLFVLPSLLLLLLSSHPLGLRRVSLAALGFVPLVAWHVFALIYYGNAFPNTALAKLNIDVPKPLLFLQGAYYFADSLQRDPITLAIVVLCAGLLIASGENLAKAHAHGIALNALYVFSIGGDFMTGRFFGAPYVFAIAAVVCEFATGPRRLFQWIPGAAALVALYALCWPGSPWRPTYFSQQNGSVRSRVNKYGIADERGYYFHSTGLLNVLAESDVIARTALPVPPHEWALHARMDALSASTKPKVRLTIGFYGYFAGSRMVVDKIALADPFLARISTCEEFRIGHCQRALPEGYLDSLRTGRNLLQDPELARDFDRVKLLATGPLFTRERWSAILQLKL